MYVMLERQLAVERNPGSYVNIPVFPNRVRMSTTSGPIVPEKRGNSTIFPSS